MSAIMDIGRGLPNVQPQAVETGAAGGTSNDGAVAPADVNVGQSAAESGTAGVNGTDSAEALADELQPPNHTESNDNGSASSDGAQVDARMSPVSADERAAGAEQHRQQRQRQRQ